MGSRQLVQFSKNKLEAGTESVRRTKEEAMNNERRREGGRQYSITVDYDERERERWKEAAPMVPFSLIITFIALRSVAAWGACTFDVRNGRGEADKVREVA